MLSDDRILEDLKALDIRDIARDLGREPNRRNVILCTFHDEKSPSLQLYPAKGRFKCYGCGKAGSTIDLYASAGNGMEFGEAVKEMKIRYLGIVEGQPKPPRRLARPVVVKAPEPVQAAEVFSDTYVSLKTFCRQHQPTETKRNALTYLTDRAFTLETIREFGLFVIPDVKATADYLLASFTREHLEQAGLFSPKTDKSKGGFMFYKHPIIIPYLKGGNIVNLQGRCIGDPEAKGWKYQFLYDRPLATMFNADILLTLEKGSKVYLTEGAFDTMAVTQKGGKAVSINGATSFKSEWVKLFIGLRACFFLDSDKAGQKAIKTLTPLFQQQQIPVYMKSLPQDCKDVNEWLIKWSGHVNGYPAFWDL